MTRDERTIRDRWAEVARVRSAHAAGTRLTGDVVRDAVSEAEDDIAWLLGEIARLRDARKGERGWSETT